ncbi:MAG: PTS glucose transporter subunit IIA [Actinomycetales bacterium]|nr:PTS glucose transporter subunit IIA [Actinomycetales bacterium]
MGLVRAPVPGTVVALDDVPDEVFATRMLGPGLAVVPDDVPELDAFAPVAGTLGSLYPHAAVVLDAGRRDRPVLVHLGLDTVELKGEGFTLHAEIGQQVLVGDSLVTWSPGQVLASGRSPVCPVLALGVGAEAVELIAAPGTHVVVGDPLFDWLG